MSNKFNIEFETALQPISEPKTKFGGQPNWIAGSEWPLSRMHGIPLRFICQICMDDLSVDESYKGKMAYLFMSDEELSYNGKLYGVYQSFDPEGGENAVILQPGNDRLVETSPLTSGPSLLPRQADRWGLEEREACDERVEYGVRLTAVEEVDYIDLDIPLGLSDSESQSYYDSTNGNKLGGRPCFLQQEEFPFAPDKSQLVLQLDQGKVPFRVEFGDIGVGYLFVEKGGDRARFLWQCC